MHWDPLPTVRASAGLPLPLTDRALEAPTEYLHGRWEDRNWRNVPGPFYGAMTDTCWCGREIAPRHVMYDNDYGQEFVYRQPRSPSEVHQLLFTARSDPFGGYAIDGDEHWTPSSVREWWRDRARLREWATHLASQWSVSDNSQESEAAIGLQDLLSYLDGDMEIHLRGYVYWLSERRAPVPGETLPDVS